MCTRQASPRHARSGCSLVWHATPVLRQPRWLPCHQQVRTPPCSNATAHSHVLVTPAQATKKTAELAKGIQNLKGFVHVSTSYVNSNLGRGSHIEEAIHPLFYRNGRRVEHAQLALQLAAMPPAKAERTVRAPPCHRLGDIALVTTTRGIAKIELSGRASQHTVDLAKLIPLVRHDGLGMICGLAGMSALLQCHGTCMARLWLQAHGGKSGVTTSSGD